jgi:hypothetical protein
MLRPQDPYDYARVDLWFRQAVDPKIFTANRSPFLGEINFREEMLHSLYEHRYYYLDGALIGHIVAEIKNGVVVSATVHTLEDPHPKRFTEAGHDVLPMAMDFLLKVIQTKSGNGRIPALVPNRNVSLSPIIR